jgi:hypothetical protein
MKEFIKEGKKDKIKISIIVEMKRGDVHFPNARRKEELKPETYTIPVDQKLLSRTP